MEDMLAHEGNEHLGEDMKESGEAPGAPDISASVRDKEFLDQFNFYFERIDEELNRTLGSRVSLIEEIGRHTILGRGKRLRPLLFILSANLCGYEGRDIYRLSIVFEYIHTSSLIHDDVLDHAHTRRGKQSANRMWGNRAAILGGDFFFSRAFSLCSGCRDARFLRVLTGTTVRMAEAEALELCHTHDWELSKERYLEIVIGKTAVLISAACECGAIISGAEQWAVEQLRQFGINAGIAFQLVDDLLDYISSEEELGKPVGNDLKEGKITLPLIYTLSTLEEAERRQLMDLFKNNLANDQDYRQLIGLVRDNGVVDRIKADAKAYADKAARCLDMFPPSWSRKMLLELNRYIIERGY